MPKKITDDALIITVTNVNGPAAKCGDQICEGELAPGKIAAEESEDCLF